MSKLSSLSIFFPVFNEEENVARVINQALELAPKISNKFEIIAVDDGSTDNTVKEVQNLIKKYKEVRVVSHKFNQGYGATLKTGFYESKYDYITYMDGDGQFDFSELNKLISKLENADLILGYRIKRADNNLRVLNGLLWNWLVSTIFNIKIRDIDCGFKLVKKEIIDKIPKLKSDGATISAELIVRSKKAGFRIAEAGLVHKPRQFGTATGGNPLHILRAFKDVLILMYKL